MLFSLAVAPIIILLVFIYIRDKYEKEPLILLGLGVLYGFFLVLPVLCNDAILMKTWLYEKYPIFTQAFVTSAGNEEGLKLLFLFFLIFRNPNFNEPIDGIVYAVFISLGFAAGENLIYVMNSQLGGIETALMRSVTSVPAHAAFAVIMGYYFSCWRYLKKGAENIAMAFIAPWIMHGLYNFILLIEIDMYLLIFVPYLCGMIAISAKKFKLLLQMSPFKFLKN